MMDCSHGGSWQRAEAAERRVWGGGTGEGQGQGDQGLGSVLGCAITGSRGRQERGRLRTPVWGCQANALSTAAVLVLRRDFERGFLEAASERAYRQGDFW